MLVRCIICKELFLPTSSVCATSCGHLYHEGCLKKWRERSSSCPQCRTVLRIKPNRIYFDVEDMTEEDKNLNPDMLKEKLVAGLQDLDEMRNEYEELKLEYLDRNEEVAIYANQALEAEAVVKILKAQVEELNKENEEIGSLRESNATMKEKLKRFTGIEKVLKGTETDVREMIDKTPVTPLAVHQLCVYVEALKSQSKSTEQKLRLENERIMYRYLSLKKKLRQLLLDFPTKKIQASTRNKFSSIKGCTSKSGLKRAHDDDNDDAEFMWENENEPKYSTTSELVFHGNQKEDVPPVPKKHSVTAQKKVVNNLERTTREDNSDEASIFPIYSGPSANRMMPAIAGSSGGIFKRAKSCGNSPNELYELMNSHHMSNVPGGSRKVPATSSRAELTRGRASGLVMK